MDHCQGEKKGKKLEHMGKDYSDFKATLEVGNKKAFFRIRIAQVSNFLVMNT